MLCSSAFFKSDRLTALWEAQIPPTFTTHVSTIAKFNRVLVRGGTTITAEGNSELNRRRQPCQRLDTPTPAFLYPLFRQARTPTSPLRNDRGDCDPIVTQIARAEDISIARLRRRPCGASENEYERPDLGG